MDSKEFASRIKAEKDTADRKIEEENLAKERKEEYSQNKGLIKQYITKAQKQYYNKNYKEALEILDKAIEIEPKAAAEAYILRCQVYMDLEEFEKAMDDINEAIKVRPTSGYAYPIRGDMYLKAKAYNEALNDYETALKYFPKSGSGPTYSKISNVFFEQGDFIKAIEYCNLAIENGTSDGDIFKTRGWAKNQIGEYNEAIDDFEEAISKYREYDEDDEFHSEEVNSCEKGIRFANNRIKKK